MNGLETDVVTRIETNLDDTTPELLGAVMARLIEARALDVWFTPVVMKKNRPGVMLSLLCEEKDTAACVDIVFAETTAFGLRVEKITRLKLAREFATVPTEFGEISIKLGTRNGQIVQRAPEFESCRAAATRAGVSVRKVFAAASAAAQNIGKS